MRRHALVLRPQPGADRTVHRLEELGVPATACPLFALASGAWQAPDPGQFDALLLTSANAVRMAGPGLQSLRALSVLAVGEATASAARQAGLTVTRTGDADATSLVAAARQEGAIRLLHLAGRDRIALADVVQITVYASYPLPIDAASVEGWSGRLALLHSARAAGRFASLVDEHGVDRASIGIVALSPTAAEAAGSNWGSVAAADRPSDIALCRRARELIDQPGWPADK